VPQDGGKTEKPRLRGSVFGAGWKEWVMTKRNALRGVAVGAVMLVTTAVNPASHAVGVFATGRITVDSSTMQGCGTATFNQHQALIVGEFVSVGYGSTMSTQENALVRDVKPIIATDTNQVSVCGEGFNFVAPPGVVLAAVQYELTVSGDNGDVVVVKQCSKGPVTGFNCFDV
jgi:hypothetical protein